MAKFKITLTATRIYDIDGLSPEEEIQVVRDDPDAFLDRADNIKLKLKVEVANEKGRWNDGTT